MLRMFLGQWEEDFNVSSTSRRFGRISVVWECKNAVQSGLTLKELQLLKNQWCTQCTEVQGATPAWTCTHTQVWVCWLHYTGTWTSGLVQVQTQSGSFANQSADSLSDLGLSTCVDVASAWGKCFCLFWAHFGGDTQFSSCGCLHWPIGCLFHAETKLVPDACLYCCQKHSFLWPRVHNVPHEIEESSHIIIRVVHSSHFWFLFGFFSISFLATFCTFGRKINKKEVRRRWKMKLKMATVKPLESKIIKKDCKMHFTWGFWVVKHQKELKNHKVGVMHPFCIHFLVPFSLHS